jgi:murein L,D-transpeptidase YafK
VASALALFGCARATAPVAGPAIAPVPDDRAPLDWAREEDYLVVVRRSCRTVSVYRRGEWLRTYRDVSFGRVPGTKLHEGDRKTPTGLYKIVGRRRHPRWERFMLLDYPNLQDVEAHQKAREQGLASERPGGAIGIHGTDARILNEGGVDWTYGCIALLNEDVRDLYSLVPNGTLVLIEK